MTRPFQWMLLGIVAILIVVDGIWVLEVHFDIDWPAYSITALLTVAFLSAGVFYATKRKDEQLAAMLFGTGFLVAFSALSSVMNYFLLTVAGHRVDGALAGLDRSLYINWPGLIAWASEHPTLNLVLALAYGCTLPEIALLIPLLGWRSPVNRIYSFCYALACATFIAMAIWTFFPSFGAISVYALPPAVVAHTQLALGPDYAHELVTLLANGPGLITPADVKGLIGFPSFHVVLALLTTWYASSLRYLRVPVAILNAVVVVSTPIQGGHHVVDVFGGIVVASVSILIAEKLTVFLAKRQTFPGSPERIAGQPTALGYP